jgi:hypothetical protein
MLGLKPYQNIIREHGDLGGGGIDRLI